MKLPKIKLVVFDYNGVTVTGDHKTMAKHFGRIHRTPWPKAYDLFYTKYYNLLTEGKISEKQAWQRPIKELGWPQDWRAMRRWYLDQQRLNPDVIKMIRGLKLSGFQTVLLSKNYKPWFSYLEQRLRFRLHFDAGINTHELGFPKASRQTIAFLGRMFDVKPPEILYLDDQESNLTVARKLGVHCILYQNFHQAAKAVDRLVGAAWRQSHHQWAEISQRQRMSPFPNVFSMQAATTITSRLARQHFPLLLLFEQRLMWVFADQERQFIAAQNLLRRVLDDPSFFKYMIAKVRHYGEQLIAFSQKVAATDLSKLSHAALARLYDRYQQIYVNMYGHYFTILTADQRLNSYLKGLLIHRVRSREELERYFNVLTTNTHAMYTQLAEQGLYQLAQQITGNKTLSALFKQPTTIILKKLSRNTLFNRDFAVHFRKFFWLPRDYEDQALQPAGLVEQLKKVLNKGQLPKKLAALQTFQGKAQKKITQAEKKLQLDRNERALFAAMRDGIYLKEFRKRYVSLSLYNMDPLLHEFSKRLCISLPELRHFLATEPYHALVKHKPFARELRERYKLSAYLCNHGRVQVYGGPAAERLKDQVLKIPNSWHELHGFAVSPGKARGPAKVVINLEDLTKVKTGDIIVTVQAVPSFSTAIKLSAGLVADGGTGITSHPATLAREANIPCITGTKVASQVIKDGDLIEVDGFRGTVKKI